MMIMRRIRTTITAAARIICVINESATQTTSAATSDSSVTTKRRGVVVDSEFQHPIPPLTFLLKMGCHCTSDGEYFTKFELCATLLSGIIGPNATNRRTDGDGVV